jgi:hypothetical protein
MGLIYFAGTVAAFIASGIAMTNPKKKAKAKR